jgi:hypothetical protein
MLDGDYFAINLRKLSPCAPVSTTPSPPLVAKPRRAVDVVFDVDGDKNTQREM